MNTRVGAFCIPLLLVFTLACQNLTVVRGVTGEETEYYVKSTVSYSNKGNKTWNFTEREEDRTIGLFMNNSWQTAYLVNSTPSIETRKSDVDGNKVAVFQFPKMLLNKGQNISYAVAYRIVSKPRTLGTISEADSQSLSEIPESLKEKYLKEEGPWQLSDPSLQSLTHEIVGSETNVLTIVKNFVSWIDRNITYPLQTHEGPQYPSETLLKQEGDCDDQAILLATMCRIVGIPAFLQIGAIYDSTLLSDESYWENHVTSIQKWIGWHGWAVVYIPPWGWLPVDLTYVFGGLSDPLNAITNAAVTSQGTIQFMNISQTNYVNASRMAKNFLITNDFYVYMKDEMIEANGHKNPFWENVRSIFPLVLVAMIALLLTSSYVVTRRLNREEQTPTLLKSATLYQANP